MNKYIRFLVDSDYRFVVMGNWGFFKNMDDEKYLKKRFKAILGIELDLDNPKTFNQKIQWLKINDRNSIYPKLVDKFEVKKWVAEKIGEEYVVPTYGIYDSFDQIDFSKIPNSFVIKCTHDSGSAIICNNKSDFDVNSAKKKIKKCMKKNLYYSGREWAYKEVTPRIIIEKNLLDDGKGNLSCEPVDYKLMCFNGKVKCTFTCTERYSDEGLKVTFFDNNWNVLPFERHFPKSKKIIEKPKSFDKMVELAEKLAEGMRFVRVDFYEVNEKIYFGEMTLYPGCGQEEFNPVEWDYKIGEMLKLQ